MTTEKEKKGTAPAPALLEESQGAAREGKFLVMGARREGGAMAPILFKDSQPSAESAAEALAATGWSTVEVYTRVSAHKRG